MSACPLVSCSTPRYTPGRRSVVGMSVAITRIGDRDAHASPTAPSVFAAPGPGRRQRDAEPPGRARVAVGRVRRRLLVAHADEPDRRLAQRLPQREVVHAGQAEADLDAGLLQLLDDDLRSGRHRAHPASPSARSASCLRSSLHATPPCRNADACLRPAAARRARAGRGRRAARRLHEDRGPERSRSTRRASEIVYLPAFDGEPLYIEVTRPSAAGRFPVILEASPYHGTLADRDGTRILPEPRDADGKPLGLTGYFAPRGYAVVMMDLRGTGRSQGCLDHLGAQGRARPQAGRRVGREPGLVERPRRHDRPLLRRLDARRSPPRRTRAGLDDDRAERRPGVDVRPPVPGRRPVLPPVGRARSRPTSSSRSSASCPAATTSATTWRRPAAACRNSAADRRRGPALRPLRRLAPGSATGERGATARRHPDLRWSTASTTTPRASPAMEWFSRRGGRAGDKLWLGQWDHGSGCCPTRRGDPVDRRAARVVRQAARAARRRAPGPPVELFMSDGTFEDAPRRRPRRDPHRRRAGRWRRSDAHASTRRADGALERRRPATQGGAVVRRATRAASPTRRTPAAPTFATAPLARTSCSPARRSCDLVASVTAPRVHLIANAATTRTRTASGAGSASSRSTPSCATGIADRAARRARASATTCEPPGFAMAPPPARRPPARAAGARPATRTRCRCSRSTRRSTVFTGPRRDRRSTLPVVASAGARTRTPCRSSSSSAADGRPGAGADRGRRSRPAAPGRGRAPGAASTSAFLEFDVPAGVDNATAGRRGRRRRGRPTSTSTCSGSRPTARGAATSRSGASARSTASGSSPAARRPAATGSRSHNYAGAARQRGST